MEIHKYYLAESPVRNKVPHKLEIEYTAPDGGEITLELYPSSFKFVCKDNKEVNEVEVTLRPAGARTTHTEMVTITGTGANVEIILWLKSAKKSQVRTFQS